MGGGGGVMELLQPPGANAPIAPPRVWAWWFTKQSKHLCSPRTHNLVSSKEPCLVKRWWKGGSHLLFDRAAAIAGIYVYIVLHSI